MKKLFPLCILLFFLLANNAAGETLSAAYGPFSRDSMAQKSYHGITLNILTHVTPNIGEPIVQHAREFEKLTGITINIKHVPWSEIYPEVMFGLKVGKYDIVTPCSDIIPDTAKYLAPLPEAILTSAQWNDVMDYHKMIAEYDGRVVQMIIDGDRHALQYRQDVLTDPELTTEYLQEFGKPLTVPTTWKELNRIAAFLNGRIFNGKKIYGIVEITNKDDLLYSNFIKRASPYAKHPDIKGGFYFDLRTMVPLINTPGWVEALKDFVAAQKYYPPGGKNFGLVDVNSAFGAGDAVFTDNWDDSFISAMEESSPCHNKVLVALSPGADKVWNRITAQWDHFNPPNQVPFISMGWTSGVAANSNNKEAAFDFLAYLSNPENHRKDLTIGRYGINPFRNSDLDYNFWINQVGWEPKVAESFVKSLQQQMNARTRTFDLRIPGSGQYMKSLQVAVTRALRGLSTPQKALDYAAKQWQEITTRYGIDSQRKHYAAIVKMEDTDNSTK
ncbi:MAG: extracellular solute-binding protein [Deltaproteobacteria bacterium]|nr:extracellular solute-binding protein [Deltaproteobacteria bacterium]